MGWGCQYEIDGEVRAGRPPASGTPGIFRAVPLDLRKNALRAEKMGTQLAALKHVPSPPTHSPASQEEAKPLKSGTRIRRPAGAEIGCAGWGCQMRYVLKISDIWYLDCCNPGLGDRTEAQFFLRISSTESRIPRCVSRSRWSTVISFFSGAAVDAACGYGETERLGLFGGVGSRLFGEEEQRAAMPMPHQLETPLASVRSAASAVQTLISERDKCFDHIPVGSHSHFCFRRHRWRS